MLECAFVFFVGKKNVGIAGANSRQRGSERESLVYRIEE